MSAWLLRYGVTPSANYTDNFVGTANPLSSPWYNNSLDKWSPCQKTPGLCSGGQVTHAGRFDDSFALMAGFTQNHFVQGTVHLAGGSGGGADNATHEIALHLGMVSSAGFAQGYECNYGFAGDPLTTGYVQIIAWKTGDNAVIGDFDIITNDGIAIHDGDIFKATKVGTTIGVYQNGTLIRSLAETTYKFNGDPGIGFYWNGTGTQNEYGLSAVTLGRM